MNRNSTRKINYRINLLVGIFAFLVLSSFVILPSSALSLAVPNALPAPTGLTATAVSPSQINLSWTAPLSNTGVSGYQVERLINGSSTWFTVASNTGTASTTYSDSGLNPNTSYTYRVSAIYSGIGTSSPSNTASATTSSTITNSIVLNNIQSTSGTVSASPYQITISNFNASTGTNSLLVVGIEANNNNVASVTFGGISLTKEISSFFNNDAEFWYLTNPSGTGNIVVTMAGATSAVVGAYSFSGVNQTTPIPTSATNHNTAASSPMISITTQNTNSWVLDLPSIYGGKTLGSPTCTQQWDVNVPSAITGASSSTVKSSAGLVTCSWTASGSGDFWDDAAIEVKASGTGAIISTAPGSPTDLTATTISSSQINLNWTAPSNNGGSAITGYQIERSNNTGTWLIIASNTSSTSTTYSDTGLNPSTSYTYRVSAINSVGTSTPSNTASATTSSASPSPIPEVLIPQTPSNVTTPSNPLLTPQIVPIPPTTNYSINQVQSGLITSDPLNNETKTQQQLQANQQYWKYGGDAPLRNAPYDFYKDLQGFHIGVQAPVNGTWAGYYSVTPSTTAMLFHSIISTPVDTVTSKNNWYTNGMYVQNATQDVNYVECTANTGIAGTQWLVAAANGNIFGATTFTPLWWSASTPTEPLTRDCTIITNGNNYLKVYLDGNMVYRSTTLKLNMSNNLITFLEPQTNYAGQLLNGTFKDYYTTTGENVTVTNNPPFATTVDIVQPISGSSQGKVLATAPVDSSGTATLSIGNYHMPLSAYIVDYDSSGTPVASTSNSVNIFGGNIYSVSGTPVSYAPNSATNTVTSVTNAVNSTVSNIVSITNSPPNVLPSPSGLTATTVSSSQISLNWNVSSISGSLIEGYMIERSQDNGITWSTVIANTGTASTIYLDSGLNPSTTYTYRVSAVYAGGITSPPSNTASATTKSDTSSLTVTTQLSTGDPLVGMYVELRNSTGQVAATGFSPATFVLKTGAQYTVGVGNFATDVFDHWADTGSTSNPRQVSISSDTQLTAVYRDTALILSPSKGPVGTNVTTTGTTFSPSTAVTLNWDGTALTTITSNSTGGFTTTFQVPNTSSGSHKIQATDGTNTHSAPFTVGPSGPTVSQPPTNLTATTISSSQINLSWTAPSDSGGSPITGYEIERSQDNATTWSIIVSNTASTSTTYSDTGLSPSTTYTYRVSAINSVGTSSPSNTAFATTQNAPVTVPQHPTNLTATTISSSQINLSWTAPSDSGSSPITGYKIERSQDGGIIWIPIVSNTASTSTTYSDTGLSPSTTYTYRVSAINSVGTSTPSNTASATTQDATTILSPSGLTATTVSSSQISLNWNVPNNSSSLITGYKIERSADSGITWSTVIANTGTASTIYLDSGLNPSTTYTYRVSAVYAGGITSPPSNTASATTLSATYQLTVPTKLSTGDTLTGMYTELRNNSGIVSTGFSPATFVLKTGAQYTVGVGNFATDVFDHWADTGSTSNPRQVSISSDTQLTAVYRDIGLIISPSRGPVGTTVSATGTNNAFSPSTAVTLNWDGTALTTITSNSTGGFTTTFQVPNTSSGSHKIQATDGTNTHSVLFIVGPSSAVTLYRTSGNAGDAVKVAGTNFLPYSRITLYFDNTSLSGIRVGQGGGFAPNSNPASIETDSNGNFVADIQAFDRPAGSYNIEATDQSNSDTKSFTLVPGALLFYPTSGHAGTIVNFRASGFAANSVITISLDGVPIITTPPSLTSDLVGEFQGSFAVSTTATVGSHQVQISDNSGNKYSNSFNVTGSSTPMFNVNTIVSGLSSPIGMSFIPDNGQGKDGSGNFMVIEQNGTVVVVKNNGGTFVKQQVPFVIVPNVQVYPDAGLLGIAFDPNWVNTKMVYFYATVNVTGVVKNEVVRYHTTTDSSGNIVADTSIGQQLVLDKIPADVDHDGGHMKFDSQGNLYIATGDNYGYTASQDLTSLAGKLLKITPLANPDSNGLLYSIPSTNPFAANPDSSIRKEIYSYGVRNTFNFDIDSQTGKIYFDHVGQSAWESIVDTTTPVNLGWSNYEGPTIGNPQNVTNYKEPLYWYPHQGLEPITGFAKDLEAVTGGVFYYGNTYPSNLQGAYFFGDYGAGFISALLSTDKNPPQVDPVTGVPKGQVQTIVSGLTLAPTDMQVWNGQIYYVDLTGRIAVLNYN